MKADIKALEGILEFLLKTSTKKKKKKEAEKPEIEEMADEEGEDEEDMPKEKKPAVIMSITKLGLAKKPKKKKGK